MLKKIAMYCTFLQVWLATGNDVDSPKIAHFRLLLHVTHYICCVRWANTASSSFGAYSIMPHVLCRCSIGTYHLLFDLPFSYVWRAQALHIHLLSQCVLNYSRQGHHTCIPDCTV